MVVFVQTPASFQPEAGTKVSALYFYCSQLLKCVLINVLSFFLIPSAGGTGVLINLDRVEDLLNTKFGNVAESGPPRVRGISDSGWFIDKLPSYSEKVDCHDVILCPPEISLKKGMNLWNARLPENCQNSFPDEPWSCFFGYRIYPTLKGIYRKLRESFLVALLMPHSWWLR